MLQEIAGLLQKLTKEASDIYYFARLIDTAIGRIEVFCEHPATCPPDNPIGKNSESKAPARSMIISVYIVFKVQYKELTIRGAW
jgi:hypothetical protein